MGAKSLQSCPTLCDSHGLQPARLLSVGFSKQEYWSELPYPRPGDLPNPRLEPTSVVFPALAGSYHQHHLESPCALITYSVKAHLVLREGLIIPL